MVDSIAGKNPIQDAGLLNANPQVAGQSVEKINSDAARDGANVASLKLLDEATISPEARQAYEAEKEILRFSRLAQRVKETVNADKVAHIRTMLDSGRINDYLRSINTDDLAESILNSPSGAFLR